MTARRATVLTNVRGRQANKCVDVWEGLTANGSRVILWPCHGGASQRWRRT